MASRRVFSQYLTGSHFIEATAENWQSEFFAVWAVVVFTIFLQEKGSAQSKQIDAPHWQTGR